MSHVIAAISTGRQVSAIGILRLSGDGCIAVAEKVFTPQSGQPLSQATNRKLILGTLRDKEGRIIDQCMAACARAPHSYTGEDTVELQCHGSPAVLSAGLEALFAAGARPAQRGEFTKRAFLNGQLALTQAEAGIDLDRGRERRGRRQRRRTGRGCPAKEAGSHLRPADGFVQPFSCGIGLSRRGY